MVENNVTSKTTHKRYEGQKVLLMSELEDTVDLINNLPGGVGWLCDIAHLKVSARSFGYDPSILLKDNANLNQ